MSWLGEVLREQKLTGNRGKIMALVAVICSCFFLYTAYEGSLPPMIQRSILLILTLPVIFLQKPSFKDKPALALIIDLALVALTVAAFVYVIVVQDQLIARGGDPTSLDIFMGVVAILVVIEATRRKIGWTLPILSAILLMYGFLGSYMPGVLRHAGLDTEEIISSLYLGEEGIFGTPVQVCADFIMIFILFGAFLRVSGAGEFFIEAAEAGFGWMRGGPAKAAVISSGLMGTVSGSAVANVVTTGTFTIPLMKKTGYKPEVAGAVEAVASTGGQIMPPLMGAAAFIMADFLQVPYWEVVVAAFIPAVLYYAALFFMVDLEAAKMGLKGVSRSELPSFKNAVLRSGYLVIPVLILIYLLGVVSYSPQKAAFLTIVSVLLVGLIREHTRINPRKFLDALIEGGLGGLEVAAVCACAGIVIGILMRTGLGLALTGILIDVSQGILPVLMVLTMLTSIVLGMGLPTSACYIIVAVLVAPAMVQMGVPPMAAHLFAFYYACLSAITPPVALAAYAGAGIADSDPMVTGLQASKLGACGFIVPFMFVYGTPLLMVGSSWEIVLAIISAMVGAYALSIALQGFVFAPLSWPYRALALIAALCLIKPGLITDLTGLAIMTLIFITNRRLSKQKSEKPVAA